MQSRIYMNSTTLGWPERILGGALGLLLLLLGFVFGTVILSLAAIAGLGLAARVWWLRRQLRRRQPETQSDTSVIEGEYRVLDSHHNDRTWR